MGRLLSCKVRPFVVVVVSPSVRSSVMDVFVVKWCKIGLRLLLITDRKLHTGFQMSYKSMTLDDLEGS